MADKMSKIVALRGMAKMIRDQAIKEGNAAVANESIDKIAETLNEILIRDGLVKSKIEDDRQ
jgi:hypothetical protein